MTDAEAWGETWRAHQDRYFQEHGIEVRVDATAAHPGEHIGPVRMRKVDSPAAARAEALRAANEEAARDPAQVLAALTRNNATFTERELDRYLPGPVKLAFGSLAQSTEMGALPTLRAATDPHVSGGQYLGPGGFLEMRGYPKVVASNRRSHDVDVQRRLWTVSEELTGVTFPV